MSYQTVEYTCGHCDTEFDIRVYPAVAAMQDDPPCPPDFDPGECPHCGVEIMEDAVLEKLHDYEDAEIENRAEAKREGK
jgi:hypothetical protein